MKGTFKYVHKNRLTNIYESSDRICFYERLVKKPDIERPDQNAFMNDLIKNIFMKTSSNMYL